MAKKALSADVARLAGVSRTTVSYVLNESPHVRISEDTRQRVLEAARELDCHPNAVARSLRRQQTATLGLVLCQSAERLSGDAVLPAVIAGISSVTNEAGFKLLLQTVPDFDRPNAYVDLVRQAHIDGMILSGPRSDDGQLLRLHTEGFPIVLLGQVPGSNLPYADVDNVAAARGAVEHLLGLGHRRIGCITSGPIVYTASAARLAGYRQALAARGLPIESSLVRYGDHWEQGHEAMRSLLESPERPTAVFVASDVVALGALNAVRARAHPGQRSTTCRRRVPRSAAIQPRDSTDRSRYLSTSAATRSSATATTTWSG